MELIDRIDMFMTEHQMIQEGMPIVIAVSGGPDSMVLLDIMHKLYSETNRLIAAHVNHGFRPVESKAEEQTVRQFAETLAIPFEAAHFDLPKYIRETGGNSQDAARHHRYRFLMDVAKRYHTDQIVLAHHADDQAETLLMRLLRGTGPEGLQGMLPVRHFKQVKLIRPLLRITKSELMRYASSQKVPYHIDSSNLKRDYTRNQLRLDVVPLLQKINPEWQVPFTRLAEMMQAEESYMNRQIQQLFADEVSRTGNRYMFCKRSFHKWHIALQRRLIKLILSYLSLEKEVSFTQVEEIRRFILADRPPSSRIQLTSTCEVIKEYDQITIGFMEKEKSNYSYSWDLEQDRFTVQEAGVLFLAQYIPKSEKGVTEFVSTMDEALFDADKLALPLVIRSRKPGDRMKIIGLNKHKKVKDMFIDKRIPPSQRDTLPILCDQTGQLLWIPGVHRSSHALISEHTRSILHIKVQTFIH